MGKFDLPWTFGRQTSLRHMRNYLYLYLIYLLQASIHFAEEILTCLITEFCCRFFWGCYKCTVYAFFFLNPKYSEFCVLFVYLLTDWSTDWLIAVLGIKPRADLHPQSLFWILKHVWKNKHVWSQSVSDKALRTVRKI